MIARSMLAGFIAVSGLAACTAGPPPQPELPPVMPLANPGFEEGPLQPHCALRWACTMHADPTSFRFFVDESSAASGKRSLCIEPTKHEPWAFATQGVFDQRLRAKRVRFSLGVRVEGVTGRGGGAVAIAHGDHGERLASKEQLVTGTQGWKTLSVELDVPAGAYDIEVGGLLEGKGRLCIDDARLEVVR